MRIRLAAVCLLLAASCTRNTQQRDEPQSEERNEVETLTAEMTKSSGKHPATGAELNKASEVEVSFFNPVTYEWVSRLEHKTSGSSATSVDLHPYCAPPVQPKGSTSPVEKDGWAGLSATDYEEVVEKLSSFDSFIGPSFDGSRKTVVLVFEPEFTSWATVQEMLASERSVKFELRPGCHSEEQRSHARKLLEQMKTSTPPLVHGWADEPSVAGFRVFVLPGDEKAAAHVRSRLGSIANVWFSRPFGEH